MVFKYDFLIIGAGVAGMSYALKVARAHKGKVCLICKTSLDEANTSFAQGGVASVTNLVVDNFDKHIEDTMIAGDFISDRRAVEQVVRNAPEQIKELVKWGVNFDRKEDTLNSVFCTMQMTLVPRFSVDLWLLFVLVQTLTSRRTTLLWRLSHNIILAHA